MFPCLLASVRTTLPLLMRYIKVSLIRSDLACVYVALHRVLVMYTHFHIHTHMAIRNLPPISQLAQKVGQLNSHPPSQPLDVSSSSMARNTCARSSAFIWDRTLFFSSALSTSSLIASMLYVFVKYVIGNRREQKCKSSLNRKFASLTLRN